MLELEHGVVKFFDDRDGKKFGFLKVLDKDNEETGEEVFFHFNDGQFVEIVGDAIEWYGRSFRLAEGPIVAMWYPQVGTKLAFDRASGRDGRDKASPWTYAEGYDNRVRELTESYFQVTKVMKFGLGGPGPDSTHKYVVWEGRGADTLSAEYPIRVLSGKLDDPLASSVNSGAGSTTRYLFEVWSDDLADEAFGVSSPLEGYWQPCDDPRPMSDEARALKADASITVLQQQLSTPRQ